MAVNYFTSNKASYFVKVKAICMLSQLRMANSSKMSSKNIIIGRYIYRKDLDECGPTTGRWD